MIIPDKHRKIIRCRKCKVDRNAEMIQCPVCWSNDSRKPRRSKANEYKNDGFGKHR